MAGRQAGSREHPGDTQTRPNSAVFILTRSFLQRAQIVFLGHLPERELEPVLERIAVDSRLKVILPYESEYCLSQITDLF